MSLASRPNILLTTPRSPRTTHPGAFRFQPRGARFLAGIRFHPSDALATPFRSIARHPYQSIGPDTSQSVEGH
jgi:hypothetical protein